jgi:hypothetical protein
MLIVAEPDQETTSTEAIRGWFADATLIERPTAIITTRSTTKLSSSPPSLSCAAICPTAASVVRVAREIELRRHTDADGDFLTAEGVSAALEIGARLGGGYHIAVSTGAQRATQTLACFLAALGERVPGGVVVEPDLRSQVEDRWRAAYRDAGSGELAALRDADPELVAADAQRLGDALRRVLDVVPDGGRALVVGHSPTNEAAVLGLTGEIVAPLAKGTGVRVVADDDGYRIEPVE